jgi:hypothetical protein
MKFSSLCTPAFIYFIVSIIYLIIKNFQSLNVMSIIFNLIIIMFWSFLLNFLCSIKLTIVAWLLIILPFFINI